eukprot:5605968-Amphidinium_carterae.1
MFRFATESREHHERFQQRMRDEAKKMCANMSEERTRVFRKTENMHQGKVAELQSQVQRFQQQFGQRVCKTVEREVKHKSEQIADFQNQIRQS